MMAARVEAAELAKRMREWASDFNTPVYTPAAQMICAALPYVEAAAAQPAPDWDPLGGPIVPGDFPPHPDAAELVRSTYPPSATAQPAPEPNCPRCEDPEAPTLHRHPPASEVLGEHGRMMALPDEVPAGQAATPVGEDIYRCTFGHLHRGKGWAVSCLGDA